MVGGRQGGGGGEGGEGPCRGLPRRTQAMAEDAAGRPAGVEEPASADAKTKAKFFEQKIKEAKASPVNNFGESEEDRKKREFEKKKNLFQVMEGSAQPMKDKPLMRFRTQSMARQVENVDVDVRKENFDVAKPAEAAPDETPEDLKNVSVKKRASLFGGGDASK